jgi:mono/diheme cytochrome c family protein
MAETWRNLIVGYLMDRKTTTAAPSDPTGPVDSVPLTAVRDPAALYQRACAACHGEQGKGDGFNAPNLPVRPTAFADSAYLSTRADDTMFDGVFAGGYILNRSHRMPAWGQTLSREQIRGLVAHLRTLCRCEGPAWGETVRDGEGR